MLEKYNKVIENYDKAIAIDPKNNNYKKIK